MSSPSSSKSVMKLGKIHTTIMSHGDDWKPATGDTRGEKSEMGMLSKS